MLKIAKEEKIFSLETPLEREEMDQLEKIGLIKVVKEGSAGQFQTRGNSFFIRLTSKGRTAISDFTHSLHIFSYVYSKWKKTGPFFSRKINRYILKKVPYIKEI